MRNQGGDLTQNLANALGVKGFKYHTYRSSKDVGILSRFPIKRPSDFNAFTKALVDLNGVDLAFYSAHLDYTNYAAYLPRGYDGNFNGRLSSPETSVANILDINDRSGRPTSIRAFLDDARTELSASGVVIMAGDFNEPSWLDWIYEARILFDRNGAIVPWTSTKLLSDAGYRDAYRVKYPNPILNPGFTWVSDNPAKQVNQLTWAPAVDERDRIDYIFYFSNPGITVRDAVIVGPSTSIVKSQRIGEYTDDRFKEPEGVWPSDHKALLTTFGIRAIK